MTTETLTLTDFLLARIAEDEAIHALLPKLGPRRASAEVNAKRRIMEIHETVGYEDEEMNEIGPGCYTCGFATDPCDTIRALAAVYADHDQYRDEWRP